MYLILRCSSVHVYSTFFRVKKLKCTCVINLHELFFRFVFVFIPLPHIYLLMIVIYSYFAHWLQLHLRHARCIILTKKIASTFLRLFNLLTVFFGSLLRRSHLISNWRFLCAFFSLSLVLYVLNICYLEMHFFLNSQSHNPSK